MGVIPAGPTSEIPYGSGGRATVEGARAVPGDDPFFKAMQPFQCTG